MALKDNKKSLEHDQRNEEIEVLDSGSMSFPKENHPEHSGGLKENAGGEKKANQDYSKIGKYLTKY